MFPYLQNFACTFPGAFVVYFLNWIAPACTSSLSLDVKIPGILHSPAIFTALCALAVICHSTLRLAHYIVASTRVSVPYWIVLSKRQGLGLPC